MLTGCALLNRDVLWNEAQKSGDGNLIAPCEAELITLFPTRRRKPPSMVLPTSDIVGQVCDTV